MRKIVVLHLILILAVILPGIAVAFDPSGLLEIHYINVGWGTSVLVIGPDGTTLLMDGGRQGMGTAHVIPYMQSLGLMQSDGLDYMMASHQHSDHIDGLTEVMNNGYDVRLAVYYNGSSYNTQNVTNFRNAALQTTAGAIRPLPLGTVIQLGDSATATCVTANGTVLGHGAVPGVSDENDRSIGLLIQYGDFDYLFAGDMGGGNADIGCTGRSTSQANVETPMAQAIMPGGEHPLLSSYGVEVVHVNHHGSESSTNSDYMNLLTPRFACVATGSGQAPDYQFPRHDVVDNVLMAGVYCITAPAATVLQNEEGYPAGSLTSYAGYCVGDIIIKTSGVANYTVDGDGAVTEGPDERAALGMPLTVPFDEPPADSVPPAVIVLQPNGGETWAIAGQRNITWSASDSFGIASFAIDYSTNAGASWLVIQPQTNGNPPAYLWTVAPTPSSACLMRITAWDLSGNSGNDISDAVFSIIDSIDAQAPVVQVTSPNGGENWDAGSEQFITWTATDNVGVIANKIEYSTNGGSNWLLIHDWINGNPESYSWTVPANLSTQCRIRVSCRDTRQVGADISDGNFAIVDASAPIVSVVSPDGGEAWAAGSVHDITWSATDNIGVVSHKLEYSTDSGFSWLSIADWTAGNPGNYSWTVPDTPSPQCRVKVSCRDEALNSGEDISESDFSIVDLPMTVTIVAPNGGETWVANTAYEISWTAFDHFGITQYKIEYSTDSGAGWVSPPIQDWTAGNPETYSWLTPDLLSTQCRIKVSCRNPQDSVGFDISDADFTIGPSSPTCDYLVGDINYSGNTNGLDVVYGVTYFKGGPPPPYSCECPPHGTLFVTGDVNGSCAFNGLDISFFVSYLKSGPPLVPCPDCPPPFLGAKKPSANLDPRTDQSTR